MPTPEVNPEINPESLNVEAVSSPTLGGVVNPLAETQEAMKLPALPTMPSVPKFTMPAEFGTQIPPGTGKYAGGIKSATDYFQAAQNHIHSPESYAQDPLKYGRTYAYDADYTGTNFARYYNAPKVFKQIGFTPWRDNESLYNQKMNWWDSYKRAAAQGVKLAGTAFNSMLPWNSWSMDATDEESANAMARAHAIGADNRGGIGAFFNNLTLDAGYTVGILAEFAAEELALWVGATALAPFTGGSSWGAAGAEAVNNFRKGTQAFNRMRQGAKTVEETTSMINKLRKEIKDIPNIRNWYKESKGAGVASKLGDLIVPSTFAWAKDMTQAAKGLKEGENLFNLARTSQGFGAFYRDAREIAAALSESKMEGGMVEQEMRERLTDEFFDKNGRMPNAEEYAKINQHAYDAGRETFLWNMPALWVSNKIVLDRAFRGAKYFKQYKEALKEGFAGGTLKGTFKAGVTTYDVTKKNLMQKLKGIKDVSNYNPKNITRSVLYSISKYGAANITEGVQEQYQEAVSAAVKDYYTAIHEHPTRVGMHEAWGAFTQRFGEQFTTSEGLHTFASGFLMGGLIQGPQQIAFEWVPKKFYQITKPEEYKEYVRQGTVDFSDSNPQNWSRATKIVHALNEVNKDLNKFFSPIMGNVSDQSILQQHSVDAATRGNINEYLDFTDDAMAAHMHTLLQTDKLDILIDQLEDMKGLSGEELEAAFGKVEKEDGDAKEFITKKIDKMINFANFMQNRYDFVQREMGTFDKAKDPIEYHAWENVKRMAVLSHASFDKTMSRMNSIAEKASRNPAIAKASSTDFGLIFDSQSRTALMDSIREELRAAKMPESGVKKSDITAKEKDLEALTNLNSAIAQYRKMLEINEENPEKTSRGTLKESKDLKESKKNLKKQYHNYLKHLAKKNDSYLFNSKLDESFIDVIDFYKLKHDSGKFAKAINILSDPNYAKLNLRIFAAQASAMINERRNMFEKSYKDKAHKEDFNNLMNELFEGKDTKMFFDPELAKAIMDGAPLEDLDFYDAGNNKLIPKDSDRYKKGIELIKKYQELHPAEEKKEEEQKGEVTETAETEEKVETTPGVEYTIETPLNKMPVELLKELAADYEKFTKMRMDQGNIDEEEFNDIMSKINDLNKLIKLPGFQGFVKTVPGAYAIIDKYNRKAKPSEQFLSPEPVAEPVGDQKREDAMDIAEAQIRAELAKKELVLTEDEKAYQDPETGEIYARVSDLKGTKDEIPDKGPAHRGTIIDAILRDFLPKDATIKTPEDMKKLAESMIADNGWFDVSFTDDFYQTLFNELSIVKSKLSKLRVITNIPTMWGTIQGKNYAGTIDILVLSMEGNKVSAHIIDLKTSSVDRRQDYISNKYGYKEADKIQLNAYRELFEQRTGIKIASIKIFPLKVNKVSGTDTYESAELLPDTSRRSLLNEFTHDFEGTASLIYSSPGSGKTELVKMVNNPDLVRDADDLIVDEIKRQYPAFERKDGESTQDFIGRFSYSVSGGKAKVDEEVLKQIRDLNDQGIVVLTGTLKFIQHADFVFTAPAKVDNPAQYAEKEREEIKKRPEGTAKAKNLSGKKISDVISVPSRDPRDPNARFTIPVDTTQTIDEIMEGKKEKKVEAPVETKEKTSVINQYNSVKSLPELISLDKEYSNKLLDPKFSVDNGITAEDLQLLYDQAYERLKEKVTFEEIQPFTAVVLKDRSVWAVMDKTKEGLKLQNVTDPTSTINIPASDVEQQVIYIAREGLEEVGLPGVEIDKAKLKDALDNTDAISSSAKESLNDAENKTQEEIDEELKNAREQFLRDCKKPPTE